MAAFYNEPNPSGDPNYSGASKGFSEVKPNTVVGGALKDLGGMVDAGAKGLYSAMNDTLKDQIRDAVEPIRADKGADVTPDQAPAIAGTGARGAKYQVAAAGEDIAADPALPEAVKAGMDKLGRMKTAFQQGNLSDTKYSAELEAQVQKFRSQYPAWKDEIDKHVSEITGQVPANALRASVLRDMISMQAASQSQVKQDQAWVQHNWEAIVFANPKITQAQAIANAATLKNDPSINALVAQKAQSDYLKYSADMVSNTKTIKAEAQEGWLRNEGARLSGGMITGAMNTGGINLSQIMATGVIDQKAIDVTLPALYQAKAQLQLAMQQKANYYDPNNPNSQPASRWLGDKTGKIIDDATAPIQNVIDLLEKGAAGQAALITNLNAARLQGDVKRMSELFPTMRSGAAAKILLGDTTLSGMLAQQLASQKDLTKAIITGSWLEINNTNSPNPPPALPAVVSMAPGKQMEPQEFRTLVQTTKDVILKGKDPQAAERAIHTLYSDQSSYAAMPPKLQMQHFIQVASPDVSAKMATLSPAAQREYYGAVQGMFTTTFRQGMADLQTVVQDKNYQVTQDPKTLQFTVAPVGGDRPFKSQRNTVTGEGRPQAVDAAQQYVDKINYGIAMYLPVLKQIAPGQELTRLSQILAGEGVNFGAPKDPGIASQIGQALVKSLSASGEQAVKDAEEGIKANEEAKAQGKPLPSAYPKATPFAGEPVGAGEAAFMAALANNKKSAGAKPQGEAKPVNTTDWGNIDRIDVDQIPAGMDARAFIKYLKENPPSPTGR